MLKPDSMFVKRKYGFADPSRTAAAIFLISFRKLIIEKISGKGYIRMLSGGYMRWHIFNNNLIYKEIYPDENERHHYIADRFRYRR